jgi:hypothetical protein
MLGNATVEDLYPLAVEAKSKGQAFIYIEIERPWKLQFSRFVRVAEMLARVIRRRVEGGVEYAFVQISVPDVLNAKRRMVERGEELLARPLRANKFTAGGTVSTTR